ncbi:MAG: ATP-binding protein [Rhodothermales bacterium]
MAGTTKIATDRLPPRKPDDLLDRDREWMRLSDEVLAPGPGLILVLGRRRAGKSFLLTRFAHAAGGFYYQATRKSDQEQLKTLSQRLADHFDDASLKHTVFPDWDSLLGWLRQKVANEPFTLVLDEFPYLADASPALTSILQSWWDHDLTDSRITLILSGSHVSAMKKLVDVDQPLYGRRTARLDIRPFDFHDAARFVPDWSPRDKLRLYGIFGGMPGHLALVDASRSLKENVARQLLDSTGRLHDEAIHAFDAFVSDADVHYSIVDAIAGGERRWSRISSRVGRQTSALSRPLDWLVDMEIVKRTAPLEGGKKPSPKRSLYHVTDPYFNFWHTFIADIRQRGLSELVDPQDLWDRFIAPRLDDYMGGVFETACRQFVMRGEHALLPFRPMEVGSWWNSDSTEEVDVVAVDGQGALLVGECKWGAANARDIDTLRRRADLVAAQSKDIRAMHLVMFGDGPAADGVIHVPMEALFEGA